MKKSLLFIGGVIVGTVFSDHLRSAAFKAVDYVCGSISDLSNKVDSTKDWNDIGQDIKDKAQDQAHEASQAVKDTASQTSEKVDEVKEQVKDQIAKATE